MRAHACVCVCLCVRVCVYCLLPKWLLTEQNKCNARDQTSDVMLRKYFCVKKLCRQVIENHSRDLQASNCAKECQLNQA